MSSLELRADAAAGAAAPRLYAPERARMAELDGLRGLAALMVALSHYVLAFQPALLGGGAAVSHFPASIAIGRSPLIAFYNPELGVAIFFVLSGYVLAASTAARETPFSELVVRRWLRLALPIFGTSALIWLLVQFGLFRAVAAGPLAKSDWLAGNYVWVGWMANDPLTMAWQSFVDLFARGRDFYNPALWTMPVEFWGSLGIFAAYCALGRDGTPPGARLIIALLVLGLVWRTAYFGFPVGAALFEFRRVWRGLVPRDGPLLVLALGTCLLAAGIVLGGTPYDLDLPGGGVYARLFFAFATIADNPVLLAHRLGAAALVAAALTLPQWRAVLRTRPCRYLGRVSFMLYLCHVPLLCSFVAAGLLHLAPALGYNAATAILLPAFLGLSLIVAELTTRAFDLPAIRVAKAVGELLGRANMKMRYAVPISLYRMNREIR
jgi:peptidoglycan/LPS O-acetylase OafA/YrhL